MLSDPASSARVAPVRSHWRSLSRQCSSLMVPVCLRRHPWLSRNPSASPAMYPSTARMYCTFTTLHRMFSVVVMGITTCGRSSLSMPVSMWSRQG